MRVAYTPQKSSLFGPAVVAAVGRQNLDPSLRVAVHKLGRIVVDSEATATGLRNELLYQLAP